MDKRINNFKGFVNSLNEAKKGETEYQEYFRMKMSEFNVKSPKDLTKEQWTEISNGWTAKDESNYQAFFKRKMKEFGVESPNELTKKEWEEIDRLWKSEEEKEEEASETTANENVSESTQEDTTESVLKEKAKLEALLEDCEDVETKQEYKDKISVLDNKLNDIK